jgi:ribosomal protein S18 acetylase RimI-like enzyme
MTIRTATVADAAGLMALWEASGLRFTAAMVPAELAGVLARDPLVLVDVDDAGAIAGSVFGTFDGRRGWVNRLAVMPDVRGRGIATELLAELERRLRALGCPRVNLLVESDNADVRAMYAKLGYQGHELIFMTKRLAPRSGGDLAPSLADEPYVFATVDGTAPGVPMFAAILEDEGLTLVLTKADADMAKLPYSYVAGRITLGVESSLDEIGLTARVSRVLADAEISCNVIAGSAHDHLFVDWNLRFRALDLLRSQ